MKNIVITLYFLVNIHLAQSQQNAEIKKMKCLSHRIINYEQIQKYDTIYIVYHKSKEKEFEQDNLYINDSKNKSYYFYNYLYFPTQIYEIQGFEKVNFKEPLIFYKSKSFICKNKDKVINVYFLKKHARQFYERKRITFIIDLDTKIKNKYKIVQVNNPGYIIE